MHGAKPEQIKRFPDERRIHGTLEKILMTK